MQTFQVYTDWARSAASLDDARLGKQRLECLQTMKQLRTGKGGYPHHPVNLMWRSHIFALGIYGMQMCMEWQMKRGFQDSIFFDLKREIEELKKSGREIAFAEPPWRRDPDFMRSHRSNLIRKQHEQGRGTWNYESRFPKTPLLMPYLWPRVDPDNPNSYELLISKADKKRIADGERFLPESMRSKVANW